MTQKELETQYNNCVNLMRKTVWNFIRQMGIRPSEFDDWFGQSYIYFIKAADSYNSSLSKFPTWMCNQIKIRLVKDFYRNKREQNKIGISVEKRISTKSVKQSPINWLDGLSRDSLRLIVYVRSNKLDIDKIIYTVNGKLKKTIRIKYVFRFLIKKNWSRKRIRSCFKNLEQLLVIQD